MDFELSDSSGTDDDLPPPHRNRFQSGARTARNVRSNVVGSSLPRMQNDMETEIHNIEQEAYCSVLRAFKAQSDAITWEKESLITELRKELRVSDEEHRELLSRVNADNVIRRIREWRKTSWLPGQPTNDHLPSPAVSASRKKKKITQSTASMSVGAPSPKLFPSTSNPRSGPPGSRTKNSKSYLSTGLDGRSQAPNQGSSGGFTASKPAENASYDQLVGRRVWTRWPDDNHFYEAVIREYNPVQGTHHLVYDMNTINETWEWVNLAEIPPEDIRWKGEEPGTLRKAGQPERGRGNKKFLSHGAVPGAGRGRGDAKIRSKKDFPMSQNGIRKKALDDIEILHTDTLIKEVERVFSAGYPDPVEIEKATTMLDEHEQALVDAIARLDDVSDGESDDGDQHFSNG